MYKNSLFCISLHVLSVDFLKIVFCIYSFLAVLGLCCCADFFSMCREWDRLSSCGAWASHCSGFSCEAQALGHAGFSNATVGSVAQAPGLSSCEPMALVSPRHVGSS